MEKPHAKLHTKTEQKTDNAKRPPFRMSHPKPVVPRGLVAVFTACIVLVFIYGAILSIMHQRSMYDHLSDPAAREANAHVLAYLDGPVFALDDSDAAMPFFTPDEISHMRDVKWLLDLLFIIYLFALGIMLGTIGVMGFQRLWDHFDELLARSMRAAGWVIIGGCLFLGAAALLDFTRLWALLHALLFPQGNWMFPRESAIITLYPGAFFARFALWFITMLIIAGVTMLAISHFMLRMRRAKAEFDERWARRAAQETAGLSRGTTPRAPPRRQARR
ncbi:TPA: DUF1461 domain-containing protein [Candidatus Woesearchaeota archaeon]|nr:DUF1461 domain-containing protein [Candidatus Woesearchaeota archaeon]